MGVVACSAVQVLLGVHLRCASVVGVHLWCGERNGSISIRDVFTGDKADGLPQLTYRDCTSPHKLIDVNLYSKKEAGKVDRYALFAVTPGIPQGFVFETQIE